VQFRQQADLGAHRYLVTVAGSVRDLDGHAMGRDYNFSFRVDPHRRDTDPQRAIQQILDRAAYDFKIPGSIIALRDDKGNTWTTTNGYAELATRAPITADMVFRIGSNTKTLVATLILALADAGRLDLDAPVNTYLASEMHAYLPAYDGDRITLRHLLNHTSGINNFTIDGSWGEAFISDPTKQYFPQELLLIANGHAADPDAPHFGQFLYSNTNYVLLGLIINKVSGMTYEDAVANGLTIPLGLQHMTVPRIGDNGLPGAYAHGYWEDTETNVLHDVTWRDASTVWSSGNVISSITDLARWGEVLGQGSLLKSATQAQRLTYVAMTDNLDYGLGIVRDKSANLIGHQGGMIGYTSQVYYVPDKGYTLALFYNRTLALHDYSAVMTYDVLKALWPDRPYPAVASGSGARRADHAPRRRPGFLTEY
jgi:D-alanyl-D-alanine carboxypeptidase